MNKLHFWRIGSLLNILINNVVKSVAASSSVLTSNFESSTKLNPVPTGLSYIIKTTKNAFNMSDEKLRTSPSKKRIKVCKKKKKQKQEWHELVDACLNWRWI